MYLLKKGDFNKFIESLISKYNVVAPVQQDIVRYRILKKGEAEAGKVVFENPLYPAKDFFLPERETFYGFRKDKIEDNVQNIGNGKNTVFFMNRCDVNGVHRNDLIMLDEPADPNYKARRQNAILVEIPCIALKRCNCVNVGLIDCYDLKIYDPGKESNDYIVDAATEKGKELIKELYLKETDLKIEHIPPSMPRDIKEGNKEVWEKYGNECFSCSACTVTCPTCTCFTIQGDIKLNLEEGHLYREWASCQLLEFTKVAGGYVFRRDRGSRGKQRIHCKFQYFREKYGHNRCVGCGRCNEACPVSINIFEYYSELK